MRCPAPRGCRSCRGQTPLRAPGISRSRSGPCSPRVGYVRSPCRRIPRARGRHNAGDAGCSGALWPNGLRSRAPRYRASYSGRDLHSYQVVGGSCSFSLSSSTPRYSCGVTDKLLLITLLVKLGVVGSVASILARASSFRRLFFAEQRRPRQTLALLAFFLVPLTLGVWLRFWVPNFLAADISFETTILLGLLVGPGWAML